MWHCAASLKNTEESLRELVAHNVKGTENLLETLLPLNVGVFNHVSTAYVCGRKSGWAESRPTSAFAAAGAEPGSTVERGAQGNRMM